MAITLLQLRRDVLINVNDLVDEVNARGERYTRSNSSTAVNAIINSAMHHYEQKLNSLYQGYLSNSISVNLLAGVRVYPLGTNFRSPLFHVKRILENDESELKPFNSYYSTQSSIPVGNSSFFPQYELEGNSLVLSAPPASNETGGIVVKFPKKLVDLVLDTDLMDDQMYDAKDCIVLRATKRLLLSKDVSGAFKNADGWDAELKEAEAAFYSQVGNRYLLSDKPNPVTYDDIYY